MQALKRVEIIVATPDLAKVKQLLDGHGLGYSVFHNVTGKGDRGVRDDDELTGVFGNVCVLTGCPPEMLNALVEGVRPLLKRTGGVCLVSDALGVRH